MKLKFTDSMEKHHDGPTIFSLLSPMELDWFCSLDTIGATFTLSDTHTNYTEKLELNLGLKA